MKESKRSVCLMAFSYISGLVTLGLVLEGIDLLRRHQIPMLVLLVAGMALLMAVTGLGWALWVVISARGARRWPASSLSFGAPPRSHVEVVRNPRPAAARDRGSPAAR